jgi:hypothetical protein
MVYIGLALLLLLLLTVAARSTGKLSNGSTKSVPIEDLFPRHVRHFDQIRQAISEPDLRYLIQRASPECRRRFERERQQIIRCYLHALREDFVNLERLGRTVAAFSPRVRHGIELERLLLGLRFRLLIWLVSARVELGMHYARPLEQVTTMIGNLASQMDALVASLEPHSLKPEN